MLRAHLVLERLQWTWKGMEQEGGAIVDDRGIEVNLWDTSPAMLQDMCQQAIQRGHERRVASKMGMGQGARACLDVLRREATHGFKGEQAAQLRHMARLAAVGAVWTRDRLAEAGYPVPPLCPLCGLPDSLRHRIYLCEHPQVKEVREKVAPAWAIALARADESDAMWVTGIFANPVTPGDVLAAKGGFHCWSMGGGLVEDVAKEDVEGPVVTDGSCTKHVIMDLCRASWAIGGVAVAGSEDAEAGNLGWVIRGPVWAALPQTAPGAEHVALAMLADATERLVQPFVDCMAVIREAALPLMKQLRPESKYAGIRLWASGREGFEMVKMPEHVKAHRAIADIRKLEMQERAVAMGNRSIDVQAKEAIAGHPALGEQWLRDVNRLAERARLAVRMIAHTLIQFPREQRQTTLRGPMRAYGRKVRWRCWSLSHERGWHCTECWLDAGRKAQAIT